MDKRHVGMYFTQLNRKQVSKSTASQIALMGQKMISFSIVMMTT
jgi:hypothetical protein